MDPEAYKPSIREAAGIEEKFLKGVAISVWQNSCDTHSNWTHFAKQRKHFGQQKGVIDAFLKSNDFWNEYENDIKLARNIGCTAFRFSFEWSRFEPAQGHIDEEAIKRYHAILDCIDSAGMEPMATLHHFTHPQWFERRRAFASADNIALFVDYARLVFSHFGRRIRLWSTFNEPTCYCFMGYVTGMWAPGRRFRFRQCGRVLQHMLRAHVEAYQAIKAMPGGAEARVGLVHQHIRFVPAAKGIALRWIRPLCDWMSYWFATRVVLDFFKTGRFRWRAPLLGTCIRYQLPAATECFDWWGINYYTRIAVDGLFRTGGMTRSEPLTDMSFAIVPEDMYLHIQAASELGRPIYITETGIADRDDKHRRDLINSYYREVLRAIGDGCDVRGVFYWTLMDNYEWHHVFKMRFGLYEWCPTKQRTQELRLREGSKALVALHQQLPDNLEGVRTFCQQLSAATTGTPHSQHDGEDGQTNGTDQVHTALLTAAAHVV